MAKTPQQITQKWVNNLSNSTQAIQDGVNGVTVSPGQAAADQIQVYLQNVMAAVNSGKTENALRSYTLDYWRQNFLKKGLPRIATGAQQAAPKFNDFVTKFQPIMVQASQQVKGMPRGTTDAALARMRVVIEAAKSYKNR